MSYRQGEGKRKAASPLSPALALTSLTVRRSKIKCKLKCDQRGSRRPDTAHIMYTGEAVEMLFPAFTTGLLAQNSKVTVCRPSTGAVAGLTTAGSREM